MLLTMLYLKKSCQIVQVSDNQVYITIIEKYSVLNVLFWECRFKSGSFSRETK